MKFTNKTWYRVTRSFLQAAVTVLSALIAQNAFNNPLVTTIMGAIVLFVSTAMMNLEEVPEKTYFMDGLIDTENDVVYNEEKPSDGGEE